MKASSICLLLVAGLNASIATATPGVQRMIELTHCESAACFTTAMQQESMCLVKEETASWGKVHVFAACKAGKDETDRVRYATLSDNPKERNSSVTTSSDAFHEATLRYLKQEGFAEKPESPAAAGERWFSSPARPGLDILIERLEANAERAALWHIGLVWTVT